MRTIFSIIPVVLVVLSCTAPAVGGVGSDSRTQERDAIELARRSGKRFADLGNGTVFDTKTGLQWASRDNGKPCTYYDAREYSSSFRGGGHSDWRLPTVAELESLFDETVPGYYVQYHTRDKIFVPSIIHLSSSSIWSSERGTGVTRDDAKAFDFEAGRPDSWLADCGNCAHVLPVRLYEPPADSPAEPEVQKAQERLLSFGYDPGVPNGLLGWKTRSAIESFQKDNQLRPTGILDEPTSAALGLKGPTPSAPSSSGSPASSLAIPPERGAFQVLSAIRAEAIRFRHGSIRPVNPQTDVMLVLTIRGISLQDLQKIRERDRYILAERKRIPITNPMSVRSRGPDLFELDLSVPRDATQFRIFIGYFPEVEFRAEEQIRSSYAP